MRKSTIDQTTQKLVYIFQNQTPFKFQFWNIKFQENPNLQSMVKVEPKEQKCSPATYRQILRNTQSKLKQEKRESRQDDQQCFKDEIQHIIQFLGQNKAYERSSFYRSIVILDNLLAQKKSMGGIKIPQNALKNVFHHFEIINKQIKAFEDESKNEKVLYASLFLILLFFQKSDYDHRLKASLYSNVFLSSFLQHFLHLPVSKYSQDSLRVCAAILAYIVRDHNWVKFQEKIINTTLQILHLCQEESTRNYLVFILKNQHFTGALQLTLIKNKNILNFLVEGLNSKKTEPSKYFLVVLQRLLRIHHELRKELMNTDFVNCWEKYQWTYPQICVNLLDHILPLMKLECVKQFLGRALTHLKQEKQRISDIRMRIVEKIQRYLPLNFFLQMMDQYVSLIKDLQISSEDKSREYAIKLKIYTKRRLRQLGANAIRIYQNLENGELIHSLSNLY